MGISGMGISEISPFPEWFGYASCATCAHGCAVPSMVLNCAQMCSYAVPCPISKRLSLNVIIPCSCPLSHLLAKAA